jgi:hypothetical protein
MRANAITLVLTVIALSVAFGQPPASENLDRVFHFTHAETQQDIQEIATVIRSLTGIRQATSDVAQNSLALRGAAAQIEMAEWLLHDLDNAPAPPQPNQSPATHEYRLPGGADDVVRVFYLAYTQTVQQFQEIATAVRSTADIRRLFTYYAPRAVAVRGTADQVAMAEWLFGQMDKPAVPPVPAQQTENLASQEYRLPGSGENVLRVFYLRHTETIQDFQELVVLVRSITDTRRVFTYSSPRAVATRGTADQIALAEWLFNQLDRPSDQPAVAQQSQDAATPEYLFPGSGREDDTVVRIFYLPHTETVQRFQEIVTQVRSTTEIRRAFIYTRPRAVALRGTASQIALADRLFKERDR